jgi:restriction system protein
MSVERDRALVRLALEAGFYLGEKEPQVSRARIEEEITRVLRQFVTADLGFVDDCVVTERERHAVLQTIAGNVAADYKALHEAARTMRQEASTLAEQLESLFENAGLQRGMWQRIADENFDTIAAEERDALTPMRVGTIASTPQPQPLSPRCPQCGLAMRQRTNSRNGTAFWGCVAYPECRGTRPFVQQPLAGTRHGDLADEDPDNGETAAWQALNGEGGLVHRALGRRPSLLEALDPDMTSHEDILGYTPGDQ